MPFAYSDFIVSTIGEELGLTAVMAIVLCYGLIVERALRIALISRDGPPPAPSTPLLLPDVDEGSFVVAGLRHSPLPGDERPCVFVHRG